MFKHALSLLLITGTLAGMTACKKTSTETPAEQTQAGNTLIKNPQKGKPFSTGNIIDITLAEQNGQVLLLAANNATGKVYAIDLKDQDATQAEANLVKAPVNNFGVNLALSLGIQASKISILNMELNPVSKTIYLLVMNTDNNTTSIVKVSKQGSVFSILDLNDVTYSALPFSIIGEQVNDMTWGDGTLYISYSHAATLVGQLAYAKAPFDHNAAMSRRSTTVFKTNWGGNYFTDAPLETMCYGEVAGVKRLMGVTVCAPGFSIKTSDIAGGGLLEVKEYFNLNTGNAVKVYPVSKSNGKTYLVEHHFNGRITRIGEKYLDESQTKFNANAAHLLENNGSKVVNSMTEEDVKILAPEGTYILSARLSDTQLMAFNVNGSLSLLNY